MPGLRVEGVSVRFGGVLALDDVTLDAQPGVVTGVIGPNGAGKTTLFNVIAGLQPADAGRVLLGEVDVSSAKAHHRARLGLARTFQRLELFGSLTVRDNVLVAAESKGSKGTAHAARVTDAALERVGISALSRVRADSLPTGTARMVELARAVAARPSVLLLDEPGSGLNDVETDRFGELLMDLATDGITVVLIEHDVDLVMGVCSAVHVLDFGCVICSGPPDDVRADTGVQAAYLGAEVSTGIE